MSNPEKVIIIGNGFDINLELPTGYDKFMESDYFNQLLKMGNSIAQHLSSVQQLEHWVDVENEMGILGVSRTSKISINEYTALATSLSNYLKMVDTSNPKKDSKAYEFLNGLLNSEHKESFLIIDFNYTDSTERILLSLGVPENDIKNKLKKVHGELKKENIIFGVEDRRDLKNGDDFLRKSTAEHYGKIVNVSEAMLEATDVDIFGSSLGVTDEDHFSEYFRMIRSGSPRRSSKFNLYYHEDRNRLQIEERISKLTGNKKSEFKRNITYTQFPV